MEIKRMNINKEYTELQYFGSINLYSTLIKHTNVFFLPDVPFKKALHPNRQKLMGANSPLLLTVPLVGGRDQKQKLKDVQISYTDPWQRIHWRGIVSNYRKSPWFEEYAPQLEKLFQLNEKFLIDLNLKTMDWVLEKLKMKLDILADVENNNNSARSTGSHQKNEISPILYPTYTQVFSDKYGFIPNLGVLDLLFCNGPAAYEYLASVSRLSN
jgi:WbqC-like protein family